MPGESERLASREVGSRQRVGVGLLYLSNELGGQKGL